MWCSIIGDFPVGCCWSDQSVYNVEWFVVEDFFHLKMLVKLTFSFKLWIFIFFNRYLKKMTCLKSNWIPPTDIMQDIADPCKPPKMISQWNWIVNTCN
jgi:hypothetical protein